MHDQVVGEHDDLKSHPAKVKREPLNGNLERSVYPESSFPRQSLDKALEDTGIELDCVASDILGISGRAMLDALASGTSDPLVPAELAEGRLREKITALREALAGRFEDHHALLIGAILSHLGCLDERINQLGDAIEDLLGPTGAGRQLAGIIAGVAARTAEILIAEIGTNMTVFRPPGTSPRGQAVAPATTNQPANAAPAAPYRDLDARCFKAATPNARQNDSSPKLQDIGHAVTLEPAAHSTLNGFLISPGREV